MLRPPSRPPRQPGIEAVDVDVEDRRDEHRQELGEEKAADDGDAERLPRLTPRAQSQGDGQGPEEGRHRRHHNRPETHHAGMVDGLLGRLLVRPLRFQGEVDHHDAVLLHQTYEHDDPHEGVEVKLHMEDLEGDEGAEPGKRQGRGIVMGWR